MNKNTYTLINDQIFNENQDAPENYITLSSTNYYNPFYVYVNGKQYEVDNILFFDKNEVLTQTSRGWFGSDNQFQQLFIYTPKAIVRKTKVALDKNVPFIIKSDCSYKVCYNLYIPRYILPKFEVSYLKINDFVFKVTDIGLPSPKANYCHENVYYLNGKTIASCALEEALKVIKDSYDVERMSEEALDNALQAIKIAWKDYQSAVAATKAYTVEDYLREQGLV